MSLEAYIGKIGAGKSYTGIVLMIDELVKGTRPIVTNLPVRFDPWKNGVKQWMCGLCDYLLEEYGKDFDARQRITILDDDQCFYFYRYRGGGVELELKYEDGKATELKTDKITGGVLYIIDETWKFFGSRNWTKTAAAALFYFSQSRKTGDDVIFLTQNVKQLDSALRELMNQWTVIVNGASLLLGPFQRAPLVTYKVYGEIPVRGATPMHTFKRKIDKKGLAQCYDTSAGVSISGRFAADINKKRKGLPWWLLWPAVCLVAWGLTFLPNLAQKAVMGTFMPQKPRAEIASTNAPAVVTTNATAERGFVGNLVSTLIPQRPNRQTPGQSSSGVEPSPGKADEPEKIWLTGFARDKAKIWIYLSDGTFLTEKDPRLKFVGEEFVVVNDKVYRFEPNTGKTKSVPNTREYNK